jgi:putative addiction module antidote
MKLEVRKIDSSLGVVLPAEVLDALHVKEGAILVMVPSEDGKGFVLRASDAEFQKQMRAARSLLSRYGATLRELSK